MNEQFNGSELVVKALAELDVDYIFGYPGGSVLDLYDALFAQNEVEHILVRHEQAATHMQMAMPEVQEKPALCLQHLVLALQTV